MAISKRLRYEILRRDGYRCQYCGSTAKDTTLQVDHLVPVALGGDDKPGNLVAACKDCNAGKSSIPADAPLAQSVSEHAAAYALALTDKMTRIRGRLQDEQEFIDKFDDMWNDYHYSQTKEQIPRPGDWEITLRKWSHMGVPIELIEYAVGVAMKATKVSTDCGEFRYMCGVVWRQLDSEDTPYELTDRSVAVFTSLEADELASERGADGYQAGWQRGYQAGIQEGRGGSEDQEH